MFTERVDVMGVNGVEAPIPVLGVFEVENGQILRLRDYADMALVQRLLRGEKVTVADGFPPGTDEVR